MHDLGGRRIVKSVRNGQRARDLFTGLTEEIRKASVGTHGSSESLHAPASRIVMSRRPATRAVVPKGRSTHSPGWSATVKLGTRGTRRLTRHQPPRGDTGHCNSRTIEHNTLSGGSIARSRSINISGIKPSATDQWLHHDQVGSMMLATNASAAVADTRHADAFGNEMASWTSGARTDSLAERSGRGHNTKKLDSDTGLVYMYQRWYLPEAGIFVSKASYPPMVEHRYEFVEADPTAANDPHGEFVNFVLGAVAGVATGSALALLTGECYDWEDAATDAAMGAVGAGLLSKANKLARLSNARKIARKDGMELKSFDRRAGMEKWDNGNGRTTIKHKPSKNAPESNYPRVEYQPARGGPRKDPFTGESGIRKGPAGHARLEPVTPGRSGAAGAGGALLNPNPSDCP